MKKKYQKLKNLSNIKKNYISSIDEQVVKHNQFKKIDNIMDKFNTIMKEIDPNVYIVKYNSEKKKLRKM